MINLKKLDIEKRQHSIPAKLTKRTKIDFDSTFCKNYDPPSIFLSRFPFSSRVNPTLSAFNPTLAQQRG